MTTRQAAHIVDLALADVCFDDTDMSTEISQLCDEFQEDGEMPTSLLSSRVQMILEQGEFGNWVASKVQQALVTAIKEW